MVRREGHARGRPSTRVDGRELELRGERCTRRSTCCTPTTTSRACSEQCSRPSLMPAGATRLSEAAVTLPMPAPRTSLPGQRAVAAQSRRPGNGRPSTSRPRGDPERRRRRAPPSVVSTTRAQRAEVVREALRLRRDQPELFRTFAPVSSQGSAAENIVAFDTGGVRHAGDPALGRAHQQGRLGRHHDRPATGQLPGRDQWHGDPRGTATSVRADEVFAAGPVALLVALPATAGIRTPFDVWAPRPPLGHPGRTSRRRPRRGSARSTAPGARRLVDAADRWPKRE